MLSLLQNLANQTGMGGIPQTRSSVLFSCRKNNLRGVIPGFNDSAYELQQRHSSEEGQGTVLYETVEEREGERERGREIYILHQVGQDSKLRGPESLR